MRKIEQQMLNAIEAGRDFVRDNTVVIVSDHIGNPYLYASVYLHTNQIAEIDRDSLVRPDLATFKRWPTATTCSRLRALGIGAHIVKGVPCIDGKPV